ncbi:MAG: Gfo/Idh/MocA family oxidoreductase [Planctomycetota bacterium]
MRFGIIGTGAIGGVHAEAIGTLVDAELVGVAGRSAERVARFAEEHHTQAFGSVDELASDPRVEIVTVATPSGFHIEPAMQAIGAGKHVVIEKPMEVTAERIDTLIDAADRQGVTLAAILNRRYHPAMEELKGAVEAGRFGRLTSASVYVKWHRNQAYYDSADWRGTWALDGGGALMNQSIHAIDALLYLAGPVRSVQARTACLAHERIEVEDIGAAVLEFESGALGVIEGATCAWSAAGHPVRVQLAGTDGSAFLADEQFEVWSFREALDSDEAVRSGLMSSSAVGGGAGRGANDPKGIDCHQHARNFAEVVAAIREGREPTTCAREARKSVALIEAVYRSAGAGGQTVRL